jgi:formylglycine-generating enzyme required for sulfatase activity
MHGNVYEWCADHWHDSYEGAPTDGSSWLTDNENQQRMLRGGGWGDDSGSCRCANRDCYSPEDRLNYIGLVRFVLSK